MSVQVLFHTMSGDILRWAAYRLKVDFGPDARTIGVTRDDRLIAAVVYNNWRALPGQPAFMCDASIYSESPRWATRRVLRTLFHYPFVQCGLRRLQTISEAADAKVCRFNERLGFTREGTLREAWDQGGDAVVWSMLPHECPWLEEDDHAERTRRAA